MTHETFRTYREVGSEFDLETVRYDKKAIDGIGLTELLTTKYEQTGRHVVFLRCGRDALGYIADDILYSDSPRIYMPALSCDSMDKPFRVRGFEVIYYRLDPELNIDTDYLLYKIREKGDAQPVILMMNFYGLCHSLYEVSRDIRKDYPDAILIEDITHTVFDISTEDQADRQSGSTDTGLEDAAGPVDGCTEDKHACFDYIIGSIRKWMGIPDGALVCAKDELVKEPAEVTNDFVTFRQQALRLKSEYIKRCYENMGDQKSMDSDADDIKLPEEAADLKTRFRDLFGRAEDSLEDGREPLAISAVSRKMLSDIHFEYIKEKRRDNYLLLADLFRSIPGYGRYFSLLREPVQGTSEDAPDRYIPECPFMLPVILDIDRIRAEGAGRSAASITRDRFESKLAAKGVYAPVLWPIDAEAAGICSNSAHFAHNMLAFYIDQRYDGTDMRYTAEVFAEVLGSLVD